MVQLNIAQGIGAMFQMPSLGIMQHHSAISGLLPVVKKLIPKVESVT
jgi:hypothetical protein